ncbi:MAG TPA: LLM class F420-dependent oxidoreductase [Chloroflexia bacterium]|nr:LLM class F420-dependent oxidoreductase [Chloroflexia bacterium]
MAPPTRFGVFVPQGWRMDLVHIEDPIEQYEAMSRAAKEAERLGLDSIWLYDHFHTVPQPEIETTFEAWIATAALARDTQRIRIGQMVSCNGYRSPAYLAKVASTVDVLSHGRLDFGIGAGWYEHEWLAYGYGFPDAPTRLKMLGEALQIIKAMWTEPYANFEGKFYQVKGAINEPKGVQKPHPPIWIGGGGEKVTLKLVARYGDASNFGGKNVEEFRRKADILKEHCDTVGRDYDEIVKSASLDALVLGPGETARQEELDHAFGSGNGPKLEEYRRGAFVGTGQELIDLCGSMMDAGVQYFLFYVPGTAYGLERMQRLAEEVVGKLRG